MPRVVKQALIVLLFIFIGFPVSVLVHESGHALGVKVTGHDIHYVQVWPGYYLLPEFGKKVEHTWPKGAIAIMQPSFDRLINPDLPVEKMKAILELKWAIIGLLGAATTWLLSFVSLLALYFLKPQGTIRYIVICCALFYYDMLSYIIFPHFFGVRHLVFYGGDSSEPIESLSTLGFHPNASAVTITAICVVQTILLIFVLRKRADLG